MLTCGIDPGVTGALATIDSSTLRATVDDLPTVRRPGAGMIRSALDGAALLALVRARVPADAAALFVLEDVHTFPGSKNSPQANGSLMHSRGVIECALAIARHRVFVVSAPAWRKLFNLTGDKEDARALALRLYPDLGEQLKRKADHNRAEALLMAHFGLRTKV